VHVSDLVVPAGVVIVTESEYGVASVMMTRASLSAEDGGDEGAEGVEGAEGEPAESEGE
jgi:hypothetical protein